MSKREEYKGKVDQVPMTQQKPGTQHQAQAAQSKMMQGLLADEKIASGEKNPKYRGEMGSDRPSFRGDVEMP